ncbi:MAG: Ni/Fe hydrogenase subunit alpha [Pseudomonadota bacterium]
MAKIITIAPVTRIEGHAKITVNLDDAGNVADARLHVVELRGFEKFCEGRPAEEMPRIVTSICGVCPWSHHLASSKTVDALYGAKNLPSAGRKLRELCNSIAFIEEHTLHFYFLAGPDFIMGPDADPATRNIMGIAKANPDLARKVVKARALAARMLQYFTGKSIHPVVSVPGGFSKPLTEAERTEMKPWADDLLEFARFSMAHAKENIFPKYLDTIKSLGVIRTGFLGTVAEDGSLDLYDGKLRLMKADGSHTDFATADYDQHIAEHVEPWSYLKFPYAKAWGAFSLDAEEKSQAIYRVNTLARLNVCDKIRTPLAQAELEEFRSQFGRPAQETLLYHYARLIELLYNAEYAVALLADPEITSTEVRATCAPKAGRAAASVEGPRGTLIHDYECDAQGLITAVNLIVGTTHNNAAMNMSLLRAAREVIKGGQYDQGALNRIEMAIRAYDPCLSCATHTIDGRIRLRVDVFGPDGAPAGSISN